MSLPIQPVSMMPLPPAMQGQGFPVQALQQALALEPSIGSQAAGLAMEGSSPVPSLLSGPTASVLNPLTGPATHSDAQLKEVSQKFEAIFMRMLFKEMRNTVEKSGLFGNSRSIDFFETMKDEQLSDSLAAAGGLGIGKMIYQKLQESTHPHQKIIR